MTLTSCTRRVLIGHGIVSNQLLVYQKRTDEINKKMQIKIELDKKKNLMKEPNPWVSVTADLRREW